MAKRKLSERQEMKKQAGREMSVYKRDDMVQKSRQDLTIREQRCVLFAISKVQPTDKVLQEYTFELSHLYDICGLDGESYTELKAILNGLADRSWDLPLKDNPDTISRVRWFSTLRTNKKSGLVTIKFHEDMMPYLLNLTGRDEFYTGYSLQYVLPMSSQYAPRLYELLKSYRKNRMTWYFETEELKRLLNAENYKNFNDFSRRVLVPAVEEINKFTDLKIAYEVKKEGRRFARVEFYMAEKKGRELVDAKLAGEAELDGQVDLFENLKALQAEGDSVKERFFRENPPQRRKKED